MKYLSLLDKSLGYHNLKVDERLPYLKMFAWQFGRYRYVRLPFEAAPAGDMFQQQIDEIFKDLQDVFGIADDIFVIGYNSNGKNHDDTCKKYYKHAGR